MTTKDADPVERPAHYCQGKIEVIDFLDDQKFNYRIGCTVKYLSRYRHKGKPLEDLQKARWYLDREIQVLQAEEEKAQVSKRFTEALREFEDGYLGKYYMF